MTFLPRSLVLSGKGAAFALASLMLFAYSQSGRAANLLYVGTVYSKWTESDSSRYLLDWQFKTSKMELQISGLSSNGEKLTGKLRISSSELKGNLVSQHDYLDYNLVLSVAACDGVLPPQVSVQKPNSPNIEDALNSFKAFDFFRRFSRCDLVVEKALRLDAPRAGFRWGAKLTDLNIGLLGEKPVRISVLADGTMRFYSQDSRIHRSYSKDYPFDSYDQAYLTAIPQAVVIDTKPARGLSPRNEKKAAALNSAFRLIQLLVDYSNRLSNTQGLGPLERGAFISAYFANKREEYDAALKGYAHSFGTLSVLDQISMQRAIKQAYDYARLFEKSLNLDKNGTTIGQFEQWLENVADGGPVGEGKAVEIAGDFKYWEGSDEFVSERFFPGASSGKVHSWDPSRFVLDLGVSLLSINAEYDNWRKKFGWNIEDAAKVASKILPNLKASLRVNHLYQNGNSMVAQLRLTDDLFKGILISRRDSIDYHLTLKIESCDGEAIRSNFPRARTLADAIRNFREMDFNREFTRCNLQTSSFVPLDDFSMARPTSFLDLLKAESRAITVSVLENGDLLMGTYAYFKAKPIEANTASASAALVGAKRFISLLKDYSDELILLRGKTAVERAAAIKSFLAEKKKDFLSAQDTLAEHYAQLSIIEKISVQRAIGIAYDYAHYFEQMVLQGGADLQIDQVIRSRPASENSLEIPKQKGSE